MSVIMNGANYKLPYNNLCRLVRTVGACKIYSLVNKGKKKYFVLLKGRVLYSTDKCANAVAYAKELYEK